MGRLIGVLVVEGVDGREGRRTVLAVEAGCRRQVVSKVFSAFTDLRQP